MHAAKLSFLELGLACCAVNVLAHAGAHKLTFLSSWGPVIDLGEHPRFTGRLGDFGAILIYGLKSGLENALKVPTHTILQESCELHPLCSEKS